MIGATPLNRKLVAKHRFVWINPWFRQPYGKALCQQDLKPSGMVLSPHRSKKDCFQPISNSRLTLFTANPAC
uniref:Uncharacterized protein n=1 Tax=virus sp. ctWpE22 TaxID=2826805 RepID=A0A8S5R7B6_9VIRU|nr:MAG TPA: hypothetical protein [virus sp. ctWpE22]